MLSRRPAWAEPGLQNPGSRTRETLGRAVSSPGAGGVNDHKLGGLTQHKSILLLSRGRSLEGISGDSAHASCGAASLLDTPGRAGGGAAACPRRFPGLVSVPTFRGSQPRSLPLHRLLRLLSPCPAHAPSGRQVLPAGWCLLCLLQEPSGPRVSCSLPRGSSSSTANNRCDVASPRSELSSTSSPPVP